MIIVVHYRLRRLLSVLLARNVVNMNHDLPTRTYTRPNCIIFPTTAAPAAAKTNERVKRDVFTMCKMQIADLFAFIASPRRPTSADGSYHPINPDLRVVP